MKQQSISRAGAAQTREPAEPSPARPAGFRPTLTICCITYNHERFIGRALDGFLAQRTDFPIEIIVHDDCSTDGTASIIQRYQSDHPGRIRAVLRAENQYALGRRIMPMFADWVDSEFLAVCEGDDYWTDPDKLQCQVDYLRTHSGAAGCFHNTVVVDEAGAVIAQSYFDADSTSFTRHDVLATLLSREPTCSLVFRRPALTPPLPAWYLRRPSDLYLDLLITEHGTIDFIRRTMGAYRRHAAGIWSRETHAARIVELIHRLMLLQEDAGFREYHGLVLRDKVRELCQLLFTRDDLRKEVDRLETVAREQRAYIGVLEKECKRLMELSESQSQQASHYLKVIEEQTCYIGQLEQRSRPDQSPTDA